MMTLTVFHLLYCHGLMTIGLQGDVTCSVVSVSCFKLIEN